MIVARQAHGRGLRAGREWREANDEIERCTRCEREWCRRLCNAELRSIATDETGRQNLQICTSQVPEDERLECIPSDPHHTVVVRCRRHVNFWCGGRRAAQGDIERTLVGVVTGQTKRRGFRSTRGGRKANVNVLRCSRSNDEWRAAFRNGELAGIATNDIDGSELEIIGPYVLDSERLGTRRADQNVAVIEGGQRDVNIGLGRADAAQGRIHRALI